MQKGKFINQQNLHKNIFDWGSTGRVSDPEMTGAKDLVVLDVTLLPGKGHSFHKHPQQEEVIFVLEGTIEQWIGEKKKILQAGDSAFIPADVVHASFNITEENARVLAILGPCVGEQGYQVVEVDR